MALGSKSKQKEKVSPIIRAIAQAEAGTTGEIRVHLSRHWIERDAFRRAEMIFQEYGMYRTTDRNAVLVYINLRRRKFAIVADEGIQAKVGQRYWDQLGRLLAEDLHATYYENAIAFTVATIGATLRKYFPTG